MTIFFQILQGDNLNFNNLVLESTIVDSNKKQSINIYFASKLTSLHLCVSFKSNLNFWTNDIRFNWKLQIISNW